MRSALALITLTFLSASCASRSHPKMLSFTPASVVIDYTNCDLHEATAMAQQFCSSVGKDAQYVNTQQDSKYFSSSSKQAFFNCVESQAKIIQQQQQNQHHYMPHVGGTPYIINNK